MEVSGSSGKDKDRAGVVGTEGGRRPTGVPTTPDAANELEGTAFGAGPPETEVLESPIRRRFTAEYKRRILKEADSCTQRGQLGALLRREGLYSSHLMTWQRQRDKGILAGLMPKKRGRKPKPKDPLVEENRRLRRENEQLLARLKKAEIIIDVQKKLSEALGIPMETPQIENDE
jgi:transposase-like protein